MRTSASEVIASGWSSGWMRLQGWVPTRSIGFHPSARVTAGDAHCDGAVAGDLEHDVGCVLREDAEALLRRREGLRVACSLSASRQPAMRPTTVPSSPKTGLSTMLTHRTSSATVLSRTSSTTRLPPQQLLRARPDHKVGPGRRSPGTPFPPSRRAPSEQAHDRRGHPLQHTGIGIRPRRRPRRSRPAVGTARRLLLLGDVTGRAVEHHRPVLAATLDTPMLGPQHAARPSRSSGPAGPPTRRQRPSSRPEGIEVARIQESHAQLRVVVVLLRRVAHHRLDRRRDELEAHVRLEPDRIHHVDESGRQLTRSRHLVCHGAGWCIEAGTANRERPAAAMTWPPPCGSTKPPTFS